MFTSKIIFKSTLFYESKKASHLYLKKTLCTWIMVKPLGHDWLSVNNLHLQVIAGLSLRTCSDNSSRRILSSFEELKHPDLCQILNIVIWKAQLSK